MRRGGQPRAQLFADPGRGRPIERNRPCLRVIFQQRFELIVLGSPNCLIQASGPLGRSDHIPQTDLSFAEPQQPVFIAQRLQIFIDRCSKQEPELIGRMGIIALRGKRCVAGQAPKDEKPRVRLRDRRKSNLHAPLQLAPCCLCGLLK